MFSKKEKLITGDSSSDKFFSGKYVSDNTVIESKSYLDKDEKIEGIWAGLVVKAPSQKAQFMILTDKRIILNARAIFGGTHESFTYSEISSVQGRRGLRFGSVELNVKGRIEEFGNMENNEVDSAVNMIRSNIEKSALKVEIVGPIEQLKKLKELLDLGIISQIEYNEKREKLLKQI